MTRRARTGWAFGALARAAFFCFASLFFPTVAGAAPIKIVASFTILADMVRDVAGNHAEVVSLVGPGGDPHTFDPSPSDAGALSGARLIVVNGLGLDGWIERLAKSAEYTGEIVIASKDVHQRTMTETEGGASRVVTDPHAWQDPRNGVLYIRAIEEALKTADPANASDYTAAAGKTIAALEAIDAETRSAISAIPASKRKVITSHDAFGYFAVAYQVELLAPEGLSTDQEPSASTVARLIDQIRAEHIHAVFIENMTDPRLIEMIRSETGAADSGTLYSDSLSPPDGPAPTYLAMLRYNIGKLVAAMTVN